MSDLHSAPSEETLKYREELRLEREQEEKEAKEDQLYEDILTKEAEVPMKFETEKALEELQKDNEQDKISLQEEFEKHLVGFGYKEDKKEKVDSVIKVIRDKHDKRYQESKKQRENYFKMKYKSEIDKKMWKRRDERYSKKRKAREEKEAKTVKKQKIEVKEKPKLSPLIVCKGCFQVLLGDLSSYEKSDKLYFCDVVCKALSFSRNEMTDLDKGEEMDGPALTDQVLEKLTSLGYDKWDLAHWCPVCDKSWDLRAKNLTADSKCDNGHWWRWNQNHTTLVLYKKDLSHDNY